MTKNKVQQIANPKPAKTSKFRKLDILPQRFGHLFIYHVQYAKKDKTLTKDATLFAHTRVIFAP
jgi:hypothetical protein